MPLKPYADGRDLRAAFNDTILPRLEDFGPEMIFISAGFDAHADDPLANLNFVEDDFAWATAALCDFAKETCAALHLQV